jgi:hypothetical protein
LTHYCLLRVSKGNKEVLLKFYVTSLGGDRAIFSFPLSRVDWRVQLSRE